jgi:hypothetical protein
MAVEYVQVKTGVLRKGDTVYEVVRFGDQTKYNPGKVVQLLGDKVAQVKLVNNGKTAKIPFKDLAVGAGLFEARTNTDSTRASRLAKYKEQYGEAPLARIPLFSVGVMADIASIAAPVTEPAAAVTEPVAAAAPVAVVAPEPAPAADEFGAWLAMGVDFLPVLAKRIADTEAELLASETTLAAVAAAHELRLATLAAELLAEREALRVSFETKAKHINGWKNIHTLLQPLLSK